jgi:dephospho-CoA kinase
MAWSSDDKLHPASAAARPFPLPSPLVYAGKPIIGLAGGIGSGKSFIAQLFAEEGCLVLSADDQVRTVYNDPAVRDTLKQWWGPGVINSDDQVDRHAVAQRVFEKPDERRRLEALIHPKVAAMRDAAMAAAADDAQVLAFVWDIPLLFEVGLNARCDRIVFVDAPWEDRLRRVRQARGWDEAELRRRENLQLGLDNKRRMSNDVLQNTADVGFARRQVQEILSRIFHNRATTA